MDPTTFIAEQREKFEAAMAALERDCPNVPDAKAAFLTTKLRGVADFATSIKSVSESVAKLIPIPEPPPPPEPTPEPQPENTPP